jgi:hypothetical protein
MKPIESSLEPLESRISPAALVGNVLTYTDADGDAVKVTFSKSGVTAADLIFSVGAVDGTTSTRQELTSIDLTGLTGMGFTLTATPKLGAGDSFGNIGSIIAPNTDLGTIKVDGDVLSIIAGTGDAGTVGLKSFTAHSMGLASSKTSDLKNVASFTVKTDVADSILNFTGGVKNLSIGGNLIETFSGGIARLDITGDVGKFKIGGSVIARDGGGGPSISIVGNTVGSVTIGGSIVGGSTNVAGGSAQVFLNADVKTVTIGKDLRGGGGDGGGSISIGNVGTLKIGGSVVAADNASNNGAVRIAEDASSITIGGSLIGGNVTDLSTISNNGIVAVGGKLGSLKVGGDFDGGGVIGVAGSLTSSSAISAVGTIGSVTIGGSIIGDASAFAYIAAGAAGTTGAVDAIKSVTVKGGALYASILAGYDYLGNVQNIDSGFGTIKIGGNLSGSNITLGSGKGADSIAGNEDDAGISTIAKLKSVKIGGAFTGIAGDDTFYRIYGPDVKKLTIGKVTYNQSQLNTEIRFDSIGTAIAISTTAS